MACKKEESISNRSKLLSLLPLCCFLLVFMGSGLYFSWLGAANAFYLLPGPVAILPAVILSIALSKKSIGYATEIFIKGAGQSNIMAMCFIFLLSGAFANVSSSIGAVTATVNLGLTFIPVSYLLAGFFLLSALIAVAMGTSVGTIAALAPIALGLAKAANIDLPLMAGSLMSGAMFGDNLSIISDTTIAATRTQGALMRDKFRENSKIAFPAAIITVLLFSIFKTPEVSLDVADFKPILSLPYWLILIFALLGLNVFLVLILGILAAGILGIFVSDYGLMQLANDIMHGFKENQEIFLLSMMIGGLSYMMAKSGGLDLVKDKIAAKLEKYSLGNSELKVKQTEISLAILVSICNLLTANNTVAIVLVGQVAKELAEKAGITPKRAASILDIFSCVIQGIIPYGFQALLLASIFSISPLAAIPFTIYPFILAFIAIFLIFIERFNFSKK